MNKNQISVLANQGQQVSVAALKNAYRSTPTQDQWIMLNNLGRDFWKETLLSSSSDVFWWRCDHRRRSAILFHCLREKAADICTRVGVRADLTCETNIPFRFVCEHISPVARSASDWCFTTETTSFVPPAWWMAKMLELPLAGETELFKLFLSSYLVCYFDMSLCRNTGRWPASSVGS